MSRLKNEYRFTSGMNISGELFFINYNLMIDFYTNTENIYNQITAIARSSYFIDHIVSRSVFLNEDETSVIKSYSAADIPLLLVPAPGPLDPIILSVIVNKMNSIMEESLIITTAELTSSLSNVTYVWDSFDEEDTIHDIVNLEDENKWWASEEPRFVSYNEDSDGDLSLIYTTWEELNMGWYEEEEDEEEDEFSKTASIIQYDFKNNRPK